MQYSAVHRTVPPLKTIVAVNRNQPIKSEWWFRFQVVEACGTFILKLPLLGVVLKNSLNVLLNAMNDL